MDSPSSANPLPTAPPTGQSRRPKLAAVIPAYNAASVVGNAINSLLQQTVPLDEIIVVDDGSTDATAAVAEATGVRVIRQANGGPGAARNTGILATEADWILLLDADDVAYPDRVAVQMECLDDPQLAVVCSDDLEGPELTISHELLWKRNHISTTSALLRRSAWQAVGGFDESRALIGVEDYHLWLRLTRIGWTVRRLHRRLFSYTPTATSLTAQTERFVKAELENVRVLGQAFALEPAAVREKERAILLQYGLDRFHVRDFVLARKFLGGAAGLGALSWPERLRLWLSRVPALARMLP
ncbi:MAG: glycosyltransferase family A protein [Gemmatimonadota bacterium]